MPTSDLRRWISDPAANCGIAVARSNARIKTFAGRRVLGRHHSARPRPGAPERSWNNIDGEILDFPAPVKGPPARSAMAGAVARTDETYNILE